MNKHTRTLALLLVLTALVTGGTWHALQRQALDTLRFSNTQTWDSSLEPLRYENPKIIDRAEFLIQIPPPSSNLSFETQEELKQLHSFVTERNPETIARIESERKLAGAYFNELTYGEIVSTTTRPMTSYFIQQSLHELSFLLMKFKAEHDRVRPSYLDSSLEPLFEVPNHPAYPSGHATESYFVALMMSELDPENREAYRESAFRIAHGREIAGVHYPSDSDAGRNLATQYFTLLKQTSWYTTYFELAKKEW